MKLVFIVLIIYQKYIFYIMFIKLNNIKIVNISRFIFKCMLHYENRNEKCSINSNHCLINGLTIFS